MGGDKVMEKELTALVTVDSGNLQTLAVPAYEPAEPRNSLDTVDIRSPGKTRTASLRPFALCRQKATAARPPASAGQ